MTEGKRKLIRPGDVVLTREAFEFGLAIHASMSDILGYFHISRSTLQRWVKETYGKQYTFEKKAEELRGFGNLSLLRHLFELSRKNAAVAIFLAKNWLGMSDDPQPVDTGEARREFTAAIKTATKALEAADLSMIADIPEPEAGESDADDSEA